MNSMSRFNNKLYQLILRLSSLSAEAQVFIGFVLAITIAAFLKLIQFQGGLPTAFEYTLAFPLLISAVCHGPKIASLAGFTTAMMCSPFNSSMPIDDSFSGGWLIRLVTMTLIGYFVAVLLKMLRHYYQQTELSQQQFQSTGLPNIKVAKQFIDQQLKKFQDNNKALLDVLNVRLANIDKLRLEHGNDKVDEIFQALASKLQGALGEQAHISQSSESGLLGIQASSDDTSVDIEEKIRPLLDQPLKVNGVDYALDTSAGIVSIPAAQVDSADALINKSIENAIEAINSAERIQHESLQVLDGVPDLSASRQIQFAIDKHQIHLCYEPRLNVNTALFSTLEVKVCWQHPKRGTQWLADFLPMLEEAVMQQQFMLWVVNKAVDDAKGWLKEGRRCRLSLDFTMLGSLDGYVLGSLFNRIEKEPEKLAARIIVEVNEKLLMRANESIVNLLKHMQHRGVNIIVTQFGDGGATVQALFRLPVDGVKLSTQIVSKAEHHSDQKRELASIIKVIRARGLTTIAEGISDKRSLLLLRQLGCEELQGPILSRPVRKSRIPWERIQSA